MIAPVSSAVLLADARPAAKTKENERDIQEKIREYRHVSHYSTTLNRFTLSACRNISREN
jgi:hypothetical protein